MAVLIMSQYELKGFLIISLNILKLDMFESVIVKLAEQLNTPIISISISSKSGVNFNSSQFNSNLILM